MITETRILLEAGRVLFFKEIRYYAGETVHRFANC